MAVLTTGIQIRDPFVLPLDGLYYLYGSTDRDIWRGPGTGFDVYTGTDLARWDGPFPAFRPPEGFWGRKNFWAPEVYPIDGAFYMFATFAGEGKNRGTSVLRAETPLGPFLPWSDGAVTPREWMCLDGSPHYDGNGEPWLVFCHEWMQMGGGTVCAMRLSKDLTKAASEPVTLFASTDASWSKKVTTPSGYSGFVTDGSYAYRTESGLLILLWSCFGEEKYQIGYAVSKSGHILGPWEQAPRPLYSKNGGHGMIFRTFEGKLMLSIHTPNNTPDERALFLEIRETPNGLELV